jgi:hypothetical protein
MSLGKVLLLASLALVLTQYAAANRQLPAVSRDITNESKLTAMPSAVLLEHDAACTVVPGETTATCHGSCEVRWMNPYTPGSSAVCCLS